MKKFVSVTCALILFAVLIVFPDTAAASALDGLKLCASLIIPSLFPFFVATKLISELGLAQLLGKAFAPLSRRLFNVSGSGGTAFIIGVTAGYPMGAAYIASLCKMATFRKVRLRDCLYSATTPALRLSSALQVSGFLSLR